MKKIMGKSLLSCSILAIMSVPTLAHAQEAAGQNAGTQLDEIIVTAQKREQRLNDVGVTVNVLTGDDLKGTGTTTLNDIQGLAPNVQIKNVFANSVTNVTIRGIGLNDYAVNNNPAAGIYVDNVYLVSPAMLSFGMFDIDRIEVLKGPQGDLYGRNTTAGAVNVISRRPSATTDVRLEVGYGSYQNWHVEGAVGGALTPTLNARFALQTVQQESGWQTNYITGKRHGKVDRTNGRLQLEWKPGDGFDVLLNAHMGYDRSDVALVKVLNNFTNEHLPYENQPYVAGSAISPNMDVKSGGVSLTLNIQLAEKLKLTAISAYEHYSRLYIEDSDGTSLEQLDTNFTNNINQYSQELRLSYSGENFELIGGGFYSEDTVTGREYWDTGDLLPLFGLGAFDQIGNTYRQRTKAAAVFAHGEWTFTPGLTLIGGIRYTDEKKRFDNATTFLCAVGVCQNMFTPVSRSYSTSNVSGKIGLNFKPTDNTLLYASVSRGFKSGGFQGQLTFDPATLTPFDDEKLTAYEVGVKSRVTPNLQFNAAVFHYDYRNMQFQGPLFDSPVGVLFGIDNVGDARVRGIEGDILWRPIVGLDLRLGMGAIDSKVTKSLVAGITQGSRLANAPEFTFNGLIRYSSKLSDGIAADITLSGSYQSKVFFDIVRNPPQAIENGYFVANGEIGVSMGEHFRVSLWAKNLFNKLYRTNALSGTIGWGYHFAPPRTIGLNLSYKM